MPGDLDSLVSEIRACRICRDKPHGKPLQHEPRPVLRVSATARIGVFGQAPGVRVHASGKPFTDPSGVRLRLWMNVTEDEFYDTSRIAIYRWAFVSRVSTQAAQTFRHGRNVPGLGAQK